MKTILLGLCATMLLGLAVDATAAEKKEKKEQKEQRVKTETGTLYHVVSFKFKATASEEQIKEVEDAFRNLKKTIKQIKKYEWGTNVSPENHAKGFTHGFILSFKTAQDRDDYLVHPDHKAFGKLLGPILEDVFVIDFWAQK